MFALVVAPLSLARGAPLLLLLCPRCRRVVEGRGRPERQHTTANPRPHHTAQRHAPHKCTPHSTAERNGSGANDGEREGRRGRRGHRRRRQHTPTVEGEAVPAVAHVRTDHPTGTLTSTQQHQAAQLPGGRGIPGVHGPTTPLLLRIRGFFRAKAMQKSPPKSPPHSATTRYKAAESATHARRSGRCDVCASEAGGGLLGGLAAVSVRRAERREPSSADAAASLVGRVQCASSPPCVSVLARLRCLVLSLRRRQPRLVRLLHAIPRARALPATGCIDRSTAA